jgi:hypothetical protein
MGWALRAVASYSNQSAYTAIVNTLIQNKQNLHVAKNQDLMMNFTVMEKHLGTREAAQYPLSVTRVRTDCGLDGTQIRLGND